MEFKEQGQKLTEKLISKKILLKKLQKLRKKGEEPMSKTVTTNVEIEQKETNKELPAVPTMKGEMHETSKSLLKSQEVGMKPEESKRKMSQTEGCVNKEDAEWYQRNVNDAFNQLKSGLLQDEQLHMLVEKFMLEIRRCIQHIKL